MSDFWRSEKFGDCNSAANQHFSFDLSVRAQKNRGWNGKAKRLGGLHVDHEFERRRSLDRNVGGLGAFEDLVDEDGGATIECQKVRAVAEESPASAYSTKLIEGRRCLTAELRDPLEDLG